MRDRGERNFFSHRSPAAASFAAACRSQFRVGFSKPGRNVLMRGQPAPDLYLAGAFYVENDIRMGFRLPGAKTLQAQLNRIAR